MLPPPPSSTLFPYTTLFRSRLNESSLARALLRIPAAGELWAAVSQALSYPIRADQSGECCDHPRSEERRVGKECRSRGETSHERKERQAQHGYGACSTEELA